MTKTVRLMVVALVSSAVGLVQEQVWALLSGSRARGLLLHLALDRWPTVFLALTASLVDVG